MQFITEFRSQYFSHKQGTVAPTLWRIPQLIEQHLGTDFIVFPWQQKQSNQWAVLTVVLAVCSVDGPLP
jgi:hypothetical protein